MLKRAYTQPNWPTGNGTMNCLKTVKNFDVACSFVYLSDLDLDLDYELDLVLDNASMLGGKV